MGIIYKPSGRAGEYAPGADDMAANLYVGCGHCCVYCYGADVLRVMPREDFFDNPHPKDGVLTKLENSAASFERAGRKLHVLLSFVCDNYQPVESKYTITREAIEILHKHGHSICTLTKGGTRAMRDIDLYRPGDVFATTLTLLDVGESMRWEPYAATPVDRIVALSEFHDAGIKTWVSLEPVIDPAVTLKIIKVTHKLVDMYKVGRMNYIERLPPEFKSRVTGIDWRKFANDAVGLLEKLGKQYLVKDDLKVLLR